MTGYFCAYQFFFSSRRRHTSLTCDWSSDVCSSDLHYAERPCCAEASERFRLGGARRLRRSRVALRSGAGRRGLRRRRSEERRVGEEGGRWTRTSRYGTEGTPPGAGHDRLLLRVSVFFFKQKTAYEFDM